MDISLSWSEVRIGAYTGLHRRLQSMSRGYRPKRGQAGIWDADVYGAVAELAVAKALNLYWADTGELDPDGDVGPYHVRHTTRLDGCLPLHRDDKDDGPFILVVGTPPELRLAGWLYARDGKHARYWRPDLPYPCYLVPQGDLEPMDFLPRRGDL